MLNALPEPIHASGFYGRIERLALAAGGAIMLALVAGSAVIAARTRADVAEARHSQDVRALTVDLLGALSGAETGQRGYLLTRKPEYLAPYRTAVVRVPDLRARVMRQLPNDPDVARWSHLIDDKMQELTETVRLEQAGQHEQAMAIVMSGRGQHAMAEAIAIAERLANRQRALLTRDLARSQAGAQLMVVVEIVAFVVLALLATLILRAGRLYVQRLGQAQTALEAANAELAAGRAQLEEAVQARTAELMLANEEIQRVAYIISHDLRAPLLNIIGFSGELEAAAGTLNGFVREQITAEGDVVPASVRQAAEEDLPEALRFIRSSTSKMDRLISAVLKLSRQGRRVLTPERLEMAALLRGVVDSLAHQATAAHAEIVLGKVPDLTCDRIAIEQIFSNLLENALKYLVEGRPGRVEVTGARHGRFAHFSVADNGRGIAERDRERIFELFRRAGIQDRPGEGIGLAHVRALVRRLGGSVDFVSTPGEGTVFEVRLPAILVHKGDEFS